MDLFERVDDTDKARSEIFLEEEYRDAYWEMLQDLEAHTDPEKDVLRKHMVEQAYRVLNKKLGTNHAARWQR